MKKLFSFLSAFTLCLILAACGLNGTAETLKDKPPEAVAVSPAAAQQDTAEKQIRLIIDNMSMWKSDEANEMYGYAITDVDKNGRLEILSSSCGGTGIYTNTDIFEVNEDLSGITLCAQEKEEGGSQADIMVQSAPVYYDAGHGIFYYVFDDLIKNGAAEYYESKRAISLTNGRVEEIFLGCKTTLYTDSVPSVVYTDAEGNPITKEDYDVIADRAFAGLEKKQATFGWVTNGSAELKTADAEEMYALLSDSYRAFSGE